VITLNKRHRTSLDDARKRKTPLIPARPDLLLSQKESFENGEAVELFARVLGGRQKLTAILQVADASGMADQVVDRLLDPRYQTWSLRRICEDAGITVADLFVTYRKACVVQAHIRAAHIIAARLPPIVEDVMERATPRMVTCPSCRGDKVLNPTNKRVACPTCDGSGKVLTEPQIERVRLALELAHLTQKAGLTLLQQQNQITTTNQTVVTNGGLEQLQQVVGDLLYSPTRRRSLAPPLDPPLDPPPVEEPDVVDVPLSEPGEPDGGDEDDEPETPPEGGN